jgi:carboxyl-terminal processing protease
MNKPMFNRLVLPSLLTAFVVACGAQPAKTETGVDIPDVPRAVRPNSPVCNASLLKGFDLKSLRDKTVINMSRGSGRGAIGATGVTELPDTIQSLLYVSKALLNSYYFGFSNTNLAEEHKKIENKLRAGRSKNLGEYTLGSKDDPGIDPAMVEYFANIKDNHTFYLPPSSFGRFEAASGGTTEPVPVFGLLDYIAPQAGGLVILDVQAASPALNAGLRRGDRLLEIDGQTFTAKATAQATYEAYDKILTDAAAKNSSVSAKYSRNNATTTVAIKAVPLPSAPAPWGEIVNNVNGSFYYLRIPSFLTNGLANQVHALVAVAKASAVKGVIVDLRDNGGGSLVEMIAAIAAFSPTNAVQNFEAIDANDLSFRYESGKVNITDSCKQGSSVTVVNPSEWTGNIAILETKYSASASEYFAQLVKQGGKATVIGEETAGVGNTATFIVPVTSGRGVSISALRAKNAKGVYLDPSVKPDKPVTDQDFVELIKGNDLALNAAFQTLK